MLSTSSAIERPADQDQTLTPTIRTFDPVEPSLQSLVLVVGDRSLHPLRSFHHHRDGDFCLPRHAKSLIDGDVVLQLLQLSRLFASWERSGHVERLAPVNSLPFYPRD